MKIDEIIVNSSLQKYEMIVVYLDKMVIISCGEKSW